jgi:1-deoxyxylulose-5-phosphate synthase
LTGTRSREDKGETTRAKSDDFAHKMYYQESDYVVVDRLTELAKKHGIPNAQMALAWMLHKPGVSSPIIGATKPHHIEDAIKALQVKLSDEEVKHLEEPYQPHPVLGFA